MRHLHSSWTLALASASASVLAYMVGCQLCQSHSPLLWAELAQWSASASALLSSRVVECVTSEASLPYQYWKPTLSSVVVMFFFPFAMFHHVSTLNMLASP